MSRGRQDVSDNRSSLWPAFRNDGLSKFCPKMSDHYSEMGPMLRPRSFMSCHPGENMYKNHKQGS